VLQKSAQAGQHSYAERGTDTYETPACAVEALLRVESIPGRVWEPACGPGSIVKVLLAHRHEVVASDIVDYGWGHVVRDFLDLPDQQVGMVIVTNPPYQLAEKFVRKALKISPLVIMLLRLQFMESARRADILDRGSGLVRIHVFSNRLPMIHRHNWTGPRASSAIAFAWYTWIRGYDGPVTIDRIKWT
jgi:hypothetical protein